MNRSFESVHAAENRSNIEKEKVAKGEKNPKDHTGCLSKVSWDRIGLENEVRSYDADMVINWSRLAIKYGIKDSKGMLLMNLEQPLIMVATTLENTGKKY